MHFPANAKPRVLLVPKSTSKTVANKKGRKEKEKDRKRSERYPAFAVGVTPLYLPSLPGPGRERAMRTRLGHASGRADTEMSRADETSFEFFDSFDVF